MVLKMAEDLMKHMKNEMKRSYTLTKTQAANPKGLGAKPRKTGYSASVYPTLPTTLEETVASVPNRTETWVQETKQTPDKALNVGIKAEKNPKDDATGQPPDYRDGNNTHHSTTPSYNMGSNPSMLDSTSTHFRSLINKASSYHRIQARYNK